MPAPCFPFRQNRLCDETRRHLRALHIFTIRALSRSCFYRTHILHYYSPYSVGTKHRAGFTWFPGLVRGGFGPIAVRSVLGFVPRHLPYFLLFPETHLVPTTRLQPRPGCGIPSFGGAFPHSTMTPTRTSRFLPRQHHPTCEYGSTRSCEGTLTFAARALSYQSPKIPVEAVISCWEGAGCRQR